MRAVDRLESCAALLVGLAWIVIASGVLIAQSKQVEDSKDRVQEGTLANRVFRSLSDRLGSPDIAGSIYGGHTITRASDVSLRQPNGTDMVLRDVSWNSEPEEMPPYHGFRGTWWTPLIQSLGGMIDLVYIKVVADRDRVVSQSGTRDGMVVPEKERAAATFRRLEFTDGLNLLTGNIIYRLPFWERVKPYVSIGAGLSLPHAEVQRSGVEKRTFSYQIAGFSIQVIAGVEFRIAGRGAVFTEYRLSYATNNVRLIDGGRLQTNLLVNHYTVGGSGYLRSAAQSAR